MKLSGAWVEIDNAHVVHAHPYHAPVVGLHRVDDREILVGLPAMQQPPLVELGYLALAAHPDMSVAVGFYAVDPFQLLAHLSLLHVREDTESRGRGTDEVDP